LSVYSSNNSAVAALARSQLDAPSDPRGRLKHSAERTIEVTSKASTSARSGPEKRKQMS